MSAEQATEQTANLIEQIVELRERRGLSWRKIGQRLHIPKSTAHSLYVTRPATCTTAIMSETQRGFLAGLVEGKEPEEAAVDAGVARREAGKFIRDLETDKNFQTALARAANRSGITVEYVMRKLRQALNAKRHVVLQFRGVKTGVVAVPDNQARISAINTALKVHGLGDARRDDVDVPRRVNLTLTPERAAWVNQISKIPVEEMQLMAMKKEGLLDTDTEGQKRDDAGRFTASSIVPSLEEQLPDDDEIEWEEAGSVAANLPDGEEVDDLEETA